MIHSAEVQNAVSARKLYDAAICPRAHALTHRVAGRQRSGRGGQRVPAEQARSRSRWVDLQERRRVESAGNARRVSARHSAPPVRHQQPVSESFWGVSGL